MEIQGYLRELPLLAVCRLPRVAAARESHFRWVVGCQHDRHRSLVREMEYALRSLEPGPYGRMPITAQFYLRRALYGPQDVPFPGDYATDDEMLAFVLSRAPRRREE